MRRILLAAFVALTAVVGIAPTANAANPEITVEKHCVATVIGVVDEVFQMGPETCFPTRAEADAYTPLIEVSATVSLTGGVETLLASTTIGVHYTNSNYGGSSISIVGTTCSGGTWPATGSWNNNIESSEHLCGSAYTTFYDDGSCATSSNYRILSRQPSLYGLNNKTSCVRYG